MLKGCQLQMPNKDLPTYIVRTIVNLTLFILFVLCLIFTWSLSESKCKCFQIILLAEKGSKSKKKKKEKILSLAKIVPYKNENLSTLLISDADRLGDHIKPEPLWYKVFLPTKS